MTMKTISKYIKHGLSFFLCLWMVCLSVPAMAAERIDLDADVSLTIWFKHGSDPIAGAFFELYRVADVSASGKYTLSGDFEDYPVSLKNLNSAQWRELANTLSGYAQRDDLTALDSGKTNAKGTLVFPNKQKSLKPGLYLVVGQRLEQGRYTYTPEPFLVCLPGVEPNGDVRDYDVVVNPKYDRDYDEPGVPGSSEIIRKVLKVWKDNGNEKNRPQKITVQLLRDGKVYDTVTLNAQNNWRYTWSGLSKKYHWTVVEKELEDYTVSISQEGTTFVVTNTYIEEKEDKEDKDKDKEEIIPDETKGSNIPPTEDELWSPPQQEDSADKPQLPQTGQLWWPVPLLLAGGLLLVLIGLLRGRGADDEE